MLQRSINPAPTRPARGAQRRPGDHRPSTVGPASAIAIRPLAIFFQK
jgi:hypothetical protein